MSTKPLDYTLDYRAFRERIGDLRGKEYWRSLEELADSPAFQSWWAGSSPSRREAGAMP